VSPSEKFCRICGTPVQAGVGSNNVNSNNQGMPNYPNVSQLPQQQYYAPAPQKKSHAKGIAIGASAAVVLIVAAVILFTVILVPKPVDVANKFIDSINNKDIKGAVSCMDPKYELIYNGANALLSNISGVNMSDFADLLPALGGMNIDGNTFDYKINIKDVLSEDVNGDNATVKVALSLEVNNGGDIQKQDAEATIMMRKFSGKGWRIVNVLGL
jgi:hypothetical protein